MSYILPEAEMSQELPLALRVEAFIAEAGEEGMQSTVIYRKFGIRKAELEPLMATLDTIENFKAPSTGGRPAMMYRYVDRTANESGQAPTDQTAEAEPTPQPALTDLTEAPAALIHSDVSITEGIKPLASSMAFYLNEEEWDAVDAALEAEVDPALVSPEPAITTPLGEVMFCLISPDLPRGVEALRAFMEAQDAPEQLEMKLPSASLPRGIDSLRALLEASSEGHSSAGSTSEEQSVSPAPKRRRRATAPATAPLSLLQASGEVAA